jgi:NDP-sugar pyrophosphorylase family protein
MKAMLFAAGKGTRLSPLTNSIPKALVKVGGITLLERAINTLVLNGFTEIIVNVHHFSEQITSYLEANHNFGIHIAVSDETTQLLDTGGGLKKAAWFFDEQPFLVYNVDVLTDLGLQELYDAHLKSGALATLAVRSRQTKRYLLVDEHERLIGWKNLATGETRGLNANDSIYKTKAFSGIHVIDPKLFKLMPNEDTFSIMDLYINICTQQPIFTFDHTQSFWTDVGKPEELTEAEKIFLMC